MKAFLSILAASACLSVSGQQCEVTKAMGGIQMTLQPGIEQVVSWDMTGCNFGIQNFTVYVQQPRPCPSCTQRNLKPSTPLSLLCLNLTSGASTSCPSFICNMGTVSLSQVELHLLLDASAKKPLDVAITTTAGLGGPP